MDPVKTSFQIIDTGLAMCIDLPTRTVDCYTKIRLRFNSLESLTAQFNLKQAQLVSLKLHSFQLHQPEHNKTDSKSFDKLFRWKYQYLSPNEHIDMTNKVLRDSAFHSIHDYRELTKGIQQLEDKGFLGIALSLNEKEKYLAKMSKRFESGYRLYCTMDVHTKVSNPQGAVFFHTSSSNEIFIKTSSYHSARNLFPCLDNLGCQSYFSQIKITVNEALKVVCSGTLESKQKKDSKVSWIFSLNKKTHPAYLGIVVGTFKEMICQKFARKIYFDDTFKTNNIDTMLSWLKSKEDLLFNLENRTDIVFIPGINHVNLLNLNKNQGQNLLMPYYYLDFFCISSEFFLDERHLEFRAISTAEFIKYKYLSQLIERINIATMDAVWIFIGLAGFFEDLMIAYLFSAALQEINFFKKKDLYFEMIREGFDTSSLASPQFASPDELSACPTFSLKSNLIFISIAAHLKLKKETYNRFFKVFDTPCQLTYHYFLKLIKRTFSFANVKKYIAFEVECSGSLSFDIKCSHNRKENKLTINLVRTPIAEIYFEQSNQRRNKVENHYKFFSPIMNLRDTISANLAEVLEKHKALFSKDYYDFMPKILVANSQRNALNDNRLSLMYCVSEAWKDHYEDDVFDLDVNSRRIEHTTQYKGKQTGQNQNKKTVEADNALSEDATQKQPNLSVIDEDETNDVTAENGEKYSLRVCLDPDNFYFFEVKSNETENLLLHQFEQYLKTRGDPHTLLVMMDSLRHLINPNLVITICNYLGKKELLLPISCKIRFVEILEASPSEIYTGRAYDTLMNILSQLKHESDGTLKPNRFRDKDHENYFYLLSIIKALFKFDKLQAQKSGFNEDSIVSEILTLLTKNDGSDINDDYYEAFLIKCLLKSVNVTYFDSISREVLRYIKIMYFNEPRNKYIITVIFRYFSEFVINNMKMIHYTIKKQEPTRFSLLEIFTEKEILHQILDYFQKLKRRHRGNPLVYSAYFRHKLFVREKIKGYRIWDLMIYGIKAAQKERQDCGTAVGNAILAELVRFLRSRKEELRDLQLELNMKNIELIAHLLWSQMSCGVAVANPVFRLYYAQIFELIFDEFSPICFFEKEKQNIFPIDHYYLNIDQRINFQHWMKKDNPLVSFKYLSLQKKTKKGTITPYPQNHTYNIRELLRQNVRLNKETLCLRSMQKIVFKIIREEKINSRIELELNNRASQSEQKNEFEISLKSNHFSMNELRAKLQRAEVMPLKVFKEELFLIIDHYRVKGKLTDEEYTEYINFVCLLINEADKILKGKAEKDEEEKKKLKIQLDFRKL